jgi:2-polyprenyl-3-methyl-5-hydroxy-6-metoxy-1,4-benzoquinol methylase
MANARGKAIDNTHLSIDQAEARGFIHRDYIAHCLRWSHVSKYIREKNRYKTARVLDVGCGKDLPLARLLHTSRTSQYVGIEYNKKLAALAEEHNFGSMDINVFFDINFSERVYEEMDEKNGELTGRYIVEGADDEVAAFEPPSIITCFEVLEHVEPAHARAMVKRMASIAALNESGCDLFISTPNWDPKVGAADNHVNEMKHEAVGYLLESEGLAIANYYGTFASQKDYDLHDFTGASTDDEVGNSDYYMKALDDLWSALGDYYDSNYLSTIFAPLFPAQARNCLWHCRVAGDDYQPAFGTPSDEEQFTSSEKWKELLL